MRDILDRLDEIMLTEKARGLLYRDPGDVFFTGSLEDPDQEIVFRDVEYYPDMPGAYDSYEEMSAVGEQLYKSFPAGIVWVNKPTGSSRAFAILTFDGPGKNKTTSFGRFFSEIKTDMTGLWKNDQLPGGWQLKKASSLKGSYYKLKPSDLFPPDSTFDSPESCVSAIGNMPGTATPAQQEILKKIQPGMQLLLNNKYPIFEDVEGMGTAIRDDLGETIGPIALIQGMITTGGAEAARRDILGNNGTYAGSSIYFPASKINGLVDSYITTPGGVEIGISSKGEKGATASVKNIADGVDRAREKGMTDILEQYSEQIKIIERVSQLSSAQLPLVLGQEQGMIDRSQAQLIVDMIKSGAKSLDSVEMSRSNKDTFEKLMTQYKPKTTNPKYNVGYHIMAVLAKNVLKELNNDADFGEACLRFLNTSPIIQLHLKANISGDSVRVTGFESKYPPDFKGTVALDASKVYAATGTNGRVTFAYNPTSNTDDLVSPADEPGDSPAAASAAAVDSEFEVPRSSVRARQEPLDPEPDEKTLGRRRRRG